MKVEYRLFLWLGVFFVVMSGIYGFWNGWTELAGPVALLLSSFLAFMVAFYIWYTGRHIGLRPEDDADGEIHQFEGDYGFFSPHSWQPLFVGFTAALCFAGLAIGWWLFIIGASLGVFALIGWTFEYWHGEHSL